MAEAQKMMNDPKFQEQMKKVTESQNFKTHMKGQQEALKDPKKLAEMEDKMKEKRKEGNDQWEKAKRIRANVEAAQKKRAEEEAAEAAAANGDDQKEAASETDANEAAASKEDAAAAAAEDDMPDIPSISLN